MHLITSVGSAGGIAHAELQLTRVPPGFGRELRSRVLERKLFVSVDGAREVAFFFLLLNLSKVSFAVDLFDLSRAATLRFADQLGRRFADAFVVFLMFKISRYRS